jgi:hypothetical protein
LDRHDGPSVYQLVEACGMNAAAVRGDDAWDTPAFDSISQRGDNRADHL